MAGINQDWQNDLRAEMSITYLSINVTRFVAALMLLSGGFVAFGRSDNSVNFVTGVWLMFSSVPLYLITNIADDIRKIRVVSPFYLDLQKQQTIYLNDIRSLLDDSAVDNESLLNLQKNQLTQLKSIESLLSDSETV
jgi:hypothetical protein